MAPPEPTSEQCSANTVLSWHADGTDRRGIACWYPRMGGYHGKALAEVDEAGHVDVYVWHNGEFPFNQQCPTCSEHRSPVVLHHCEGDGFVLFGQFLEKLGEEALHG